MRTNIEIDDELMAEAQKVSGQATKRQTVEQALRLMIRLRRQQEVRAAFGKYRWRQPRPEPRRTRDPVIVVGSSVWIDFLNGRNVLHVRQLDALLGADEIIAPASVTPSPP
jgi:Arc/MetJ family transcription regulator